MTFIVHTNSSLRAFTLTWCICVCLTWLFILESQKNSVYVIIIQFRRQTFFNCTVYCLLFLAFSFISLINVLLVATFKNTSYVQYLEPKIKHVVMWVHVSLNMLIYENHNILVWITGQYTVFAKYTVKHHIQENHELYKCLHQKSVQQSHFPNGRKIGQSLHVRSQRLQETIDHIDEF